MQYEALFLDFYGTLVYEDDRVIANIVQKIASASPVQPDPATVASFWWSSFRGLFDNSFSTSFQSQRDLESQSIKAVLRHFACTNIEPNIEEELFSYWVKPDIFPDTKDFLDKNVLPICIVSNIDRNDIQEAFRYHGLSFDMLITSEDAKAYKPRSEIFQLALAKMSLSPHQVLHVGDSLSSDVQGATRCGIDAFWLNRQGRSFPSDFSPTYHGASLFDIFSVL